MPSQNTVRILTNLTEERAALKSLLDRVEPKRATRAVDEVKITAHNREVRDGVRLLGAAVGTSGTYLVRVTLKPTRGFHCTCADFAKRGKDVGPCKHVISFARYFLWNVTEPRLHDIREREAIEAESETNEPAARDSFEDGW